MDFAPPCQPTRPPSPPRAPVSPTKPYLAYTVAFDLPGNGGCRQLARMLGASMARTLFGGDFLIVRNSPEPLFLVQRDGVREFFVEATRDGDGGDGGWAGGDARGRAEALAREAVEWKGRVAEEVIGNAVAGYSRVLFVDADCLALRNLDHLLDPGDAEVGILYHAERRRPIQESVFNGYLSTEEMRGLSRDGINSEFLTFLRGCPPERGVSRVRRCALRGERQARRRIRRPHPTRRHRMGLGQRDEWLWCDQSTLGSDGYAGI